jgi:hypothetical protein
MSFVVSRTYALDQFPGISHALGVSQKPHPVVIAKAKPEEIQ